jgi:D-alanyl-D-alanine carboxypeptidase (penicillin-binding protein 5/6)
MAVCEVSSGRLLLAKDGDKRLPMASTTKVVTAITVIENCDIKQTIAVSPKAVGVEGSSIYLQPGERLTVEDLLYGLMLQSGNDAAEALAYHVSGSIPAFAALMNATAEGLGCTDSHFVNPHGLHDDKHYTTASDLARIAAYAMRNEDFHRIVGTKTHKTPWEGRSYGRVLTNKNKILSMYEGGNGVKTGFTKKAGRCLVASARRRGMEVVCVVLSCGDMWNEVMTLMDRAFAAYRMHEVLPAYVCRVPVTGGMSPEVHAQTQEGFSYPVKAGEADGFEVRINLPDALPAPVACGAPVGEISVYAGKRLLNTQKIYTIEEVTAPRYSDYLRRIAEHWSVSNENQQISGGVRGRVAP